MLNPPNATLEAYLEDVAGYLRDVPPAMRESELQELSGHLAQLTDDLHAQGHSVQVAATLAIDRFGSSRRVGLRLRDVWEGNRGAVTTFLAVVGSNWLLQTVSLIGFFYALIRTTLFNDTLKEPLAPLFGLWICGGVALLPLTLNFLLGQWGGRRVIGAALLAYAPLVASCLFNLIRSSHAGLHFGSFSVNLPLPSPIFPLIAAGCGAWAGSLLRRRRRWALINHVLPYQASLLLRQRRPLSLTAFGVWLSVPVLAGLVLYGMFKQRVDAVNHPPTPEAAVRTLLSAPGMNVGDMAPSTHVTTRLLPPTTPQERAGLERRVAYTATLHATPEYRQRRIAYYQKNLQRAREGRQPDYPLRYLKASLQRLSPEGYTISRIARVKHTAQGWQMDTSGDVGNDPKDWLYNALYGYIPEKSAR